ncbi:hypothetical protein E1218_35135 [Kribbella turkmenica]|uniref:Uncharacterized protein n=1 Tax=Kribbella turkmenica TaxID=2530375 RepID=A0A4R4W354_9ACTN|nr:hypothetical protein [Kribbella turkmenica]TDD12978.1 hypothetical protein E1218_35135 [Kribbella turkmenica]
MSTTAFSPTAARIHGWATILAPVLLLGSTLAFISEDGINDGVAGGTLGVWSTFLFVIAFAGLYRVIESRLPRIGPMFMALTLIGFTAGTAFNVQAMYYGAYGTDLLADLSEGRLPQSPAVGIFAFLPWGLLVPVTLVATGILLWVSRSAPPWSAILLILGGVLFVASRPERVNALAIVADVVLVLALAPIGWTLMRRKQVVSDVMATV